MKQLVIVVPALRVSAMALFPVILIQDKALRYDRELMNHEHIHLRQQAETLVLPFYVIYVLNYLLNLAVCRNHHKAYLNIVFEREAYQNEHDMDYLSKRTWFSWYKCF